MELNYWTSSACRKASYDEASKEWSVLVERDGELLTLRPKQLVLATGMSGFPEVPTFRAARALGASSTIPAAIPRARPMRENAAW